MANNAIYRNSITVDQVSFGAGNTNSAIFECVNLTNRGNSQIRRFGFPSTWTIADVSFRIFEDATFTNGKILYISDGVDNVPLVLSAVAPLSTVSIQAPWTDAVAYVQLISSVAQVSALNVDVILQPLYQVPA